ncbi:MAG TPA: DUF6134 family protein [Stellaceae bacterium]|jgi:hypothetical protein|nr:DUF6134 family protein [Stellaceae bacterium]
MTEKNGGSYKGRLLSRAGIFGLVAIAVIVLLGAVGSAAAAGTPFQLTYRVTHSVFGNIGTYVNTVEPANGGTTVLTRAHFDVKMLGVNLYREDAQRTEHWQGSRLISFHGVTSKGAQSTVVNGQARGNSFVITSPLGTITAPATVHPANPWSSNFLASDTMMRPDTGKVERVRVSGGEPAVVTIDGTAIRTQKYQVTGDTHYTVWLDQQGVPVMFVVDDQSGTVTFTLANCVSCGLNMAQLGPK